MGNDEHILLDENLARGKWNEEFPPLCEAFCQATAF